MVRLTFFVWRECVRLDMKSLTTLISLRGFFLLRTSAVRVNSTALGLSSVKVFKVVNDFKDLND